jgi:hypothetical protein
MNRARSVEFSSLGFVLLLSLVLCPIAQAAVTIDMVTVGNPGNAPDTRYDGISVGSVDHVYQIGKYETTAGQYTEFLNAVAKADTNQLYSQGMGYTYGYDFREFLLGANIRQSGSSPNYSYSVAAAFACARVQATPTSRRSNPPPCRL